MQTQFRRSGMYQGGGTTQKACYFGKVGISEGFHTKSSAVKTEEQG